MFSGFFPHLGENCFLDEGTRTRPTMALQTLRGPTQIFAQALRPLDPCKLYARMLISDRVSG